MGNTAKTVCLLRRLLIFGTFCLATSAILSAESRLPRDSLSEVWASSVSAQPRYLAGTLRLEAEALEALALERERWPDLRIEARGDYGQRARPGEERDQGMAARGEILALVNWNLLESGRVARERAVSLRREGVSDANAVLDLAFRAEVARLYLLASLALERRERLLAARSEFSQLAGVVRQRLREGVEPGSSREHLEKSETAWAVRWREVDMAAETTLLQLALVSDRADVHPYTVQFSNLPKDTSAELTPPALAVLRRQGEERRAQAEAIAQSNRWRLDAIGQAGPYFSSAFSGRVEEEYYAGLSLSWSPDAAAVQRTRALAEMRRARSFEAEKAALNRDLVREREDVRRLLSEVPAHIVEWEKSIKNAEAAERVAYLRWSEGVGSWRVLLDERERLLETRLSELAWREQLALMLVDYAENSARLDELPAWIGQTKNILP
jgi:hypothetical protein